MTEQRISPGGQPVEIVRDLLVAHLQCLIQGHALDDLGQCRAGGDCGAAAEGLKPGLFDHLRLGIHPQREPQRVADRIRVGDCPRVAGIEGMRFGLVRVFPLGSLLDRRV